MKIFLIRHGEQIYPYNEEGGKLVSSIDAPLADLGKQQMRELKMELDREGITIDAVYRSPVLRAEKSANELLGEQSAPEYVVDELNEIFPNSAEGHTYEEVEVVGGDIYEHPFGPQETLDHLIERSRVAKEFILRDVKERGYNCVAIVGHGDPLCALDWSLKHADNPTSYSEMRDSYYPQKGQAVEYTVDDVSLKLEGEGRIITTEAAKQTIEGFRNSNSGGVES